MRKKFKTIMWIYTEAGDLNSSDLNDSKLTVGETCITLNKAL